jgi:hypothetical protein
VAAQSFWLPGAWAAAATAFGCVAMEEPGKTLRQPSAATNRIVAPGQIRIGNFGL